MKRVLAGHVRECVAVGSVLVRHWVPWLRPEDEPPYTFMVALAVGAGLVLFHGTQRNREDCAREPQYGVRVETPRP